MILLIIVFIVVYSAIMYIPVKWLIYEIKEAKRLKEVLKYLEGKILNELDSFEKLTTKKPWVTFGITSFTSEYLRLEWLSDPCSGKGKHTSIYLALFQKGKSKSQPLWKDLKRNIYKTIMDSNTIFILWMKTFFLLYVGSYFGRIFERLNLSAREKTVKESADFLLKYSKELLEIASRIKERLKND